MISRTLKASVPNSSRPTGKIRSWHGSEAYENNVACTRILSRYRQLIGEDRKAMMPAEALLDGETYPRNRRMLARQPFCFKGYVVAGR
jgi:hypothetical protein